MDFIANPHRDVERLRTYLVQNPGELDHAGLSGLSGVAEREIPPFGTEDRKPLPFSSQFCNNMRFVAVLFFSIEPGRKVCKKTGLAHRASH